MEGLPEQHEPLDHVEPRIYVASLSDYNNGHLHGRWIAAAQSPQRIYEEIHQMLATSPTLGAEEWAIHDYEGFAPHEIYETEDISTISQFATQTQGPPKGPCTQASSA
ncbi:MAG: antirestriction protein ArdA [Acidimicrobiaceae bacterium]|nr:antirestriction protein ArdA [Acidimicrobiaceae bacterium]MYD07437.1 antirestriction protein ArdA [Acidimicrobiaceae bacterium]MYI57785.1 antirestriction protein ArdA [Acidimicrobiaceae bacterium]